MANPQTFSTKIKVATIFSQNPNPGIPNCSHNLMTNLAPNKKIKLYRSMIFLLGNLFISNQKNYKHSLSALFLLLNGKKIIYNFASWYRIDHKKCFSYLLIYRIYMFFWHICHQHDAGRVEQKISINLLGDQYLELLELPWNFSDFF